MATLVKVFDLLSRLKDYLNIASPGLDTFVYIMRVRIPIMTSPSERSIIKAKIPSHLEQLNHNAAGIDLGSGEHWVCVPGLSVVAAVTHLWIISWLFSPIRPDLYPA